MIDIGIGLFADWACLVYLVQPCQGTIVATKKNKWFGFGLIFTDKFLLSGG